METHLSSWTVAEIAKVVGGTTRGDENACVKRAIPAGYDDATGITFAESEKYLDSCLATNVAAVIVWKDAPDFDKPAVLVENPRVAFGRVLALMNRPLPIASGVHEQAVVDPGASVDPTASIGAFAVVESGAEIGANCQIFPFAYIGADCKIGKGTVVFPHAVLYREIILGENCIVHSGAIIGADGFGFNWDGTTQQKVPQIGGVHFGDNVEIGANTCIDRATCGETVIGDDVKFDNMVHIAHNVTIGDHSVIAAQVGISGSSNIGEQVTMGGQVAISDHVTIASGTVLGGRSGAFQDVEEAGQYFGLPPLPLPTAMRLMALQQRLPDLFSRMKKLERQVEEMSRSEEL